IALLPDDAEVAQLEAMALTDEDVERREIPMEVLATMQFAEHLENAGHLAADGGLGPRIRVAREKRAQVAVRCVLERKAVEHRYRRAAAARERECVEHANGAGMSVEQLPEVRFAKPSVDSGADLDADGFR